MSGPQEHNVLTAALRYAAHGIHVFPVNVSIVVVDGKKKKNCSPIQDWRTVSTTSESTIRTWWSTSWAGASIAIDCGKSNLVVVDPDGAEGIANWAALAPLGIPATWRAATPGGGEHWYYAEHPNRVVGIDSAGKVARKVDVRGLGGFVIAPPSTDARGGYRWLEGEPEWGQLPTVPDLVIEAMNGKKATPTTTAPASAQAASRHFSMEQAEKYIEPALAQLRSAPDGTINATLNNAAITVGHFVPEFFSRMQAEKLLLDALAFTVYDAKTWKAEATIESGISAADWKAELAGQVTATGQHELLDDICPGWRTEAVTTNEATPAPRREMLPPPGAPLAVARVIARDHIRPDGTPTLRYWRGGWMRWSGTRWVGLDTAEMSSTLYKRLEQALYTVDGEVKEWNPNRRKIGDVLDALGKGVVLLPGTTNPPVWLGPADKAPDHPIVACTNGLLSVPTRVLHGHDPAWFNLISVPFDYDADAPAPKRWLAFLDQLWPNDPASVTTLQQWFGYVLAGTTAFQKALLIVGPRRSGKGTIGRILQALIGKDNCAGPTLASLGRTFGLQPLLGKPVAIISDARLGRDNPNVVVERLLSITGEDTLDIDRKYLDAWTGRLPTRIMVLSNELPNFGDASGAIASRFVVLQQTESWLGREDVTLEGALVGELPGILNWSLDGLAALLKQGRFTEPPSSRDAVEVWADSVSPLSAFVRERCDVGAGLEVPISTLYLAWKAFCGGIGRSHVESAPAFGRNLRSVVPTLKHTQPRDGKTRIRVYQGITLRSGQPTQNASWHALERAHSQLSSQQPVEGLEGLLDQVVDDSTAHNSAERVPTRSAPPAGLVDATTAQDQLCIVCRQPLGLVRGPKWRDELRMHPTCLDRLDKLAQPTEHSQPST